MTKQEFMAKHDFKELDFRNLVRYERVRELGQMNMFEYLTMMSELDINGGKRLASWICSGTNYNEFLEVIKNKEIKKMKRYYIEFYLDSKEDKEQLEKKLNDLIYNVNHNIYTMPEKIKVNNPVDDLE